MGASPSSSVLPCGQSSNKPEPKWISVRVSLFFDGTGNNQTNTAHREAKDWTYKFYSSLPGTGSYDNDYSNVSKMSTLLLEDSPGYDRHFKIYVEGIGTQDNADDIVEGLATGQGITGITTKVASGLSKAIDNICKVPNPDKKIKLITIDVFGFSRGAAAARHCIHRAMNSEKGYKTLKERVQEKGFEVSEVKVDFAGLYDTVSSYGFNKNDDVAELHLKAVAKASKVLHLVAGDEYRENFAITNIDSKGSTEITLPGAHSDIGGGYCDNQDEEAQVIDIDSFVPQVGHDGWVPTVKEDPRVAARLAKDKRWLLESGWCVASEIDPPTWNNEIIIRRKGLRNTYARIPLNIMCTWAKESTLNFSPKLTADTTKYALPPGDALLKSMSDTLGPKGQGNWKAVPDVVKKLRNKYFHFSARYGTVGMAPCWSTGDVMTGVRERQTISG